ncbi:glycosyltransferase family protein [Halomonas organivorans]|uniref:Glycosyltransferase involved in cell wall biosynthesis n=1 Tax=Halomonas organivorans TaxID=257772 RepID=A0A7W5G7K9_9GAMM|nr:glycosyltransferase [Halomonas organivorans]MBB3142611.1 glycosyltransferase involved in cell wall biosynthesis [Halomonas organivorans]
MTKRVLICGNPDLNYIDGSSIWAQTIALATAATGSAQVEFLARSTPARDELYAPLKANANVTILDGSDRQYWQGRGFARITPAMMGELAIRLDRETPYDVIIVRGLEIATQLLEAPDVLAKCWMYLTDIPQAVAEYTHDQRLVMQRLAQGCQRLLCQTEGFQALWQALVPDLEADKVRLYTPVIPDLPDTLPPIVERPRRAIYAGKFKGDWMTLEMAEAWPAIHRELVGSELVMIGDKIHGEPDRPDYKSRMLDVLGHTSGLRWLGAQSREAVQQQLLQARVGLSWRHEGMNDTVEYSTKILEYGGAGCAAILNRNPLHEQLLGHDYPLFANSDAEFRRQLTRALNEPQIAQQAADALRHLAERHTFSTRVSEMRQWLKDAPKAPVTKSKTKVLVAGHDLKFFTLLQKKLEATGQFEFLVDQWQGHNKHDEARSHALLEQVDVIFCEWCLGNLQWYSHNKKPHQRLVARFHAQESRTPYMGEANWDNIDHISFVSEHTRRQALEVFTGFPLDKTSVIPNYLDDTKFTPKKKTGDARFTLGMVGVAPKSKRLDRAVDLLETLLEEDNRYSLRVKGKHPLDYEWLLKREDELVYYHNLFERINSNPRLRHKVIFDPPGDDVNEWFTMIGIILSPSDHESFHMAIGEGMLTGAMPVIWDWEGAVQVWGEEAVVSNISQAKSNIFTSTGLQSRNFKNMDVVGRLTVLLGGK